MGTVYYVNRTIRVENGCFTCSGCKQSFLVWAGEGGGLVFGGTNSSKDYHVMKALGDMRIVSASEYRPVRGFYSIKEATDYITSIGEPIQLNLNVSNPADAVDDDEEEIPSFTSEGSLSRISPASMRNDISGDDSENLILVGLETWQKEVFNRLFPKPDDYLAGESVQEKVTMTNIEDRALEMLEDADDVLRATLYWLLVKGYEFDLNKAHAIRKKAGLTK